MMTSPWGRDAFQCEDNDQPDHLVAILRYMGGITGTFTMTAFEEGRHLEIYGTRAKLRAGAFYKANRPRVMVKEAPAPQIQPGSTPKPDDSVPGLREMPQF